MSSTKKDFYGKEVTDAIKKACDDFAVGQERLDIDVIETGSTGIFGLIRKKAHIKASIRVETEEEVVDVSMESLLPQKEKNLPSKQKITPKVEVEPAKKQEVAEPEESADTAVEENEAGGEKEVSVEVAEEPLPEKVDEVQTPAEEEKVEVASPESLELIERHLLEIVELMGFPSTLDVECEGLAVTCTLRGEFEESLIGPDGKVLDSLQYLLRKIITRKVPERLRISLNVGDFREQRLEQLKVRAVELAALVKEDGKTQVLPALNPSERRAIHMILQEDKDIRSRSVGDGLFKKILIYKPGKGNRGRKKRSQGRGRQNKGGQNSSKSGSDS